MMLENCCYDFFEMTTLNMAREGLFGEIVHVEGAYIHDLRELQFDRRHGYVDHVAARTIMRCIRAIPILRTAWVRCASCSTSTAATAWSGSSRSRPTSSA